MSISFCFLFLPLSPIANQHVPTFLTFPFSGAIIVSFLFLPLSPIANQHVLTFLTFTFSGAIIVSFLFLPLSPISNQHVPTVLTFTFSDTIVVYSAVFLWPILLVGLHIQPCSTCPFLFLSLSPIANQHLLTFLTFTFSGTIVYFTFSRHKGYSDILLSFIL
jgi:hypothetical protein